MSSKVGNVWQETFLVSLAQQGGTEMQAAGVIGFDTFDVDLGDKDFDQIVLSNGGRLEKFTPEGETTISMEVYVLEVGNGDVSAATTLTGVHDLLFGTEDSTQFITITNTGVRDRYRLSILFSNDTTVTTANGAVANGKDAFRMVFADGFVTSAKVSTTDGGVLKVAFTFKVAPYDETGAGNIQFQSMNSGDTGPLPALGAYTTSNKF